MMRHRRQSLRGDPSVAFRHVNLVEVEGGHALVWSR
jgi:hypothetical protein